MPPIVVAVADRMEVVVTLVGTRVPFTGATQYPTPERVSTIAAGRTFPAYQLGDSSIYDQD